jgi:preprotein translocase subunit YajC
MKGIVTKVLNEDLEIKLEDNTLITRKFWEIRKPIDN